jgi:DNA-binding CsgD family transcriptional regulator
MTATLDDVLSAREAQLVAMLARGYTTDRAARELKLSRHTVGEVISVLLERFHCSNRAALVAYCYVHRLLPLGVWPPPCCLPDAQPRDTMLHAQPRHRTGTATPADHPAHLAALTDR